MKEIRSIKKRSSFILARDKGERFPAQNLILQIVKSEKPELEGFINIGFTATKKLGRAPIRNRIKRRIRSAVMELIEKYGHIGHHHVFICRHRALESDYEEILRDVKYVLKKAGKQIEDNSAGNN